VTIALVAVVWGALQKGFRYSIAPTPDGVRISSGLLTTVTRTLPPGRIHAVEITQNLLWRPFGWWSVRINRMGGQSEVKQNNTQNASAATVLPVGTRADVERVVSLLLPDAPANDALFVWEHGVLGPQEQDSFTTVPRRGFVWHWLQRRRLGVRVTDYAVLIRRGRLGRRLAIFPLARMQGVGVTQGIIARAQNLAHLRVHTVPGPVAGEVSSLDAADAQALAELTRRGAVAAARPHPPLGLGVLIPRTRAAPAPRGPGRARSRRRGTTGLPDTTGLCAPGQPGMGGWIPCNGTDDSGSGSSVRDAWGPCSGRRSRAPGISSSGSRADPTTSASRPCCPAYPCSMRPRCCAAANS
jgi:putative membrane protein